MCSDTEHRRLGLVTLGGQAIQMFIIINNAYAADCRCKERVFTNAK